MVQFGISRYTISNVKNLEGIFFKSNFRVSLINLGLNLCWIDCLEAQLKLKEYHLCFLLYFHTWKGNLCLGILFVKPPYQVWKLCVWLPFQHPMDDFWQFLNGFNNYLIKQLPRTLLSTRDSLDCFASPWNTAKLHHLTRKNAVFQAPEFPLTFRTITQRRRH